MLTCSIEEPLRANDGVYVFDEVSHQYVSDTFGDPRLVRYTFRAERDAWQEALPAVGQKIIAVTQVPAHWVRVWPLRTTGSHRYYLRALGNHLRRDGWQVAEDATLGVALQSMAIGVDKPLWPSQQYSFDGVTCIVLGAISPGKLLNDPTARTTLSIAAKNNRFVPSRAFFDWLVGAEASVLYEIHDYQDRLGLIMIGIHRLPIQLWHASGFLDQVVTGLDVERFWL